MNAGWSEELLAEGLAWLRDERFDLDLIGFDASELERLIERAIRNSSKSRDIVLDPFGGSGSTLIACEKAGRQTRLIELDPRYVDTIILRWQEFSGGAAVLDGSEDPVRRRLAMHPLMAKLVHVVLELIGIHGGHLPQLASR